MADLTTNYDRPSKGVPKYIRYALGAIHCYKGQLLMVLRGTGYAVLAANTALGKVIGVAMEEVDNSAGAAGALTVLVRTGTIERFLKGTAAITDVGVLATASDSDTVATGGTEVVNVGRIVGFESTTHVWVDLADHSIDSHAS